MRAVFGCVVGLVLAASVGSAHGQSNPRRLASDETCEEQCRADRTRDDATCEDKALLLQSTREQCHESVEARLSVCLRICYD
jgi:hypothetical protein